MTTTEAAALHSRASAGGRFVIWFITLSDPAHPGRAVAYALVASNSGGHRLPGELVTDTIEDLRAMLPTGLRRLEPSGLDPVGTVEVWD